LSPARAVAEATDKIKNPKANFLICLSLVPGIRYARSGTSPPHGFQPSDGLRERNSGFRPCPSRKEARRDIAASSRGNQRAADTGPNRPRTTPGTRVKSWGWSWSRSAEKRTTPTLVLNLSDVEFRAIGDDPH